ncbi:MAG: hypothetical protein ACREIV_14400, partial [Planctomycetaceae bacterium]
GVTVLTIAAFIVLLTMLLPRQAIEAASDQAAFLDLARQVRDTGGPAGLLADLFDGLWPEANRHPLYVVLLSFRPTFRGGKWLSAAVGTIGLVVLTAGVHRKFGGMTAAVFATLLATNSMFCRFSTLVVADGLVIVLSGLVWLTVTEKGPGPARTVLCGVLLGLLYLAKGTGLILLFGFVVWQIVSAVARSRQPTGRGPWALMRAALAVALVLLTWAMIASPLLVRNVQRFGSPTYNVNTFLLFADEYTDPVQLAAEKKTVANAVSDYLASHSAGSMLRRFGEGLVWETFILLRSLGPVPLDDARFLFGLVIALLAAVGMLAERRRDAGLVIVWLALLVPLFGWYVPIAAGERFLAPLLVPTLAYAACGA